jgi:hypothetical protein
MICRYDVRWVLEYQSSPAMMLTQDMLVLAKTLAASVALLYVTRPHQLIVCEGVSYTATQSLGCIDDSGTVQPQTYIRNSTIGYGTIQAECAPQLDVHGLDSTFKALIVFNQALFASFVLLRFAALKQWKLVTGSEWLKAHSLLVVIVFYAVAFALAVVKMCVASSYAGLQFGGYQVFTPPPIRYAAPLVHIALPTLSNCTSVSTTGADGRTTFTTGTCEAIVPCQQQCHLRSPVALETLCSVYFLATFYFYIVYLGYEFHRSLCLDQQAFTLTGQVAKIARLVTPLMSYLPDLSALAKYVLVAITIGESFTERGVVYCNDQQRGQAEVSGTLLEEGCHPSVEPELTSRRSVFMGFSAIQFMVFSFVIGAKHRTPWASYAGKLVRLFILSQVLLLGVQLLAIGDLSELTTLHHVPTYSCGTDTGSGAGAGVDTSALWQHGAASGSIMSAQNLQPCEKKRPTAPPTLPPSPPSPPTPPTPPTPHAPTPQPGPTPPPLPTPTPNPAGAPTQHPTAMPTPVPTAGYSCFLKGGGTEVWLNVTIFQQNTRPTPAPPTGVCTGSSSGLNKVSCAAWQDLAKATNIAGWTSCSGALLDPCSCDGGSAHGTTSVSCADGDITTMYLSSNNLKGTIPSSLASLSKVTGIQLFENALTGLVPPLPFKQYNGWCELDAGAFPASDGCKEPNCNHFKCPLPAGSEQCKDINGDAGVHCPTPAPPTPPTPPTPAAPTSECTGSSSGLNKVSCAAWQDLAKATNIAGWSECSGLLLDPCSCKIVGGEGVTCADGDITSMDLENNNLKGTIPSSLGSMTKLQTMDFGGNYLKGTIPSSLGSMTELITISLAYNTLTGLVPPLPFKQYSDCVVDIPPGHYGCTEPHCNHFKCPLPARSEQCNSRPGAVDVHCK